MIVGRPKLAQVLLIIQNISKACASLETPKFKDKDHSEGCQGEFAKGLKKSPLVVKLRYSSELKYHLSIYPYTRGTLYAVL
jgi:hypothetical protein